MKSKIFKYIISVLIFINILIYSSTSFSKEPDNIDIFEDFYVEVIKDGNLYRGILLDEESYNSYTQLKIDYKLLDETLQIWKDYGEANKLQIKSLTDNTNTMIEKLEDVKKTIVRESFWDKYKFEFGITIGVLATLGIAYVVKEL